MGGVMGCTEGSSSQGASQGGILWGALCGGTLWGHLWGYFIGCLVWGHFLGCVPSQARPRKLSPSLKCFETTEGIRLLG